MSDIDILGTLAPNAGSTAPLTRAEYVIGAVLVVANAAARDLIPSQTLRNKQICLLGDTGVWYQWNGSSWVVYTGFGGGSGGGAGFPMTFSATTTDADPGAGGVRLNNATPASATSLFIDDVEAEDGTNIRDLLAALGTYVGAQVRLQSKSANENWIVYKVGGYTAATGYSELTGLTVVDSSATVTLPTTAQDLLVSIDFGLPKDLGNQAITGLKAISYNGESDAGDSSTADSIDWSTSALFKSRLTGNCVYTFTGAPQPFTYVQLRCTQDTTGGRTITLPGSCVSLDGVSWQPNPVGDATSFLVLYYDGTNYWYYGRAADARVITESTTARTFGLADIGAYIENTSGSAVSYTVPPNSTTAFPIGAEITGAQGGAGQITFVQGSGVTIKKPATRNRKTAEQESCWALKKIATDTWRLTGDLELV